ncbi:low temperature requirement protein LtrA [Micromonospora pisi]|uniref:Low temperature requirement protein LtrA n=1 Tax=Micromonospora pisi TaxID=589240 RepID=A0A495JQ94_9ACTN|nr:low temperature requirement protein A [Micromonospora pisi]RKR90552.1 low temperature requirement protein LtrA [Micromonospora pisi]
MGRQPAEKPVTWEELFFDLAFVFALTQFSHLLHEEHTWAGLGKTLILFISVYWIWGGVVLYTDQQDVGRSPGRAVVLALGFGSLLLAMTIPEAYSDRGLLFVSVTLAGRILLGVVTFRSLPVWWGFLHGPHGVVLVTGPLLLAGALTEGAPRIVLWAVAACVDLLSPRLARRTVGKIRVQPRHYTHRYGLLIMLVFGESVIEVGAVSVGEPLTAVRVTAMAAAYGLVCALWWVYFGYGVSAFRRALERAEDQARLRRAILVYGHLLFSLAIIGIADGLGGVVRQPEEPLPGGEVGLFFGGAALFLATFAYAGWRIRRGVAWRRVGASVTCLALLPVGALLPALAALGVLILVVVGLGVTEEIIRRHAVAGSGVSRPGRRPDPSSTEENDHGAPDQLDRGPVAGD